MRKMAAILLPLLLASSGGHAMSNPNVAPAGSSESFEVGYRQGCLTGKHDGGREGFETSYVKDDRLYASDADYRAGWNLGHQTCYDYEIAHPSAGGILR
jgi:hypothetical protein